MIVTFDTAVPVIHKKTGTQYLFLGYALNSTNDIDGDLSMVVYMNPKDNRLYVRKEEEFNQKFCEFI